MNVPVRPSRRRRGRPLPGVRSVRTSTMRVPSPAKVSPTRNVSASRPDSQALAARPDGSGTNRGTTIRTDGTWTWPTVTCSAG
ncbi:hypothetical protein [Streptomyces calvus]